MGIFPEENGCVIKIAEGGKLTIKDSSSGGAGRITGGNNTGNGGGRQERQTGGH
ncbi:MAG: hypothetical protein K6G83_14160 [Lachnospiraceae bacterium]|nr:hypothetical protein [Lachnospiraceae bacterium]